MTDPQTPDPDDGPMDDGRTDGRTDDEDTPAFDIDLEPEDQGTAEAAAEPSG